MSSPAAASIKPVHTRWMDVAGNPSLYPVFDALRATATTAPTRSPIRRRPRTSIRAAGREARLRGQRAATVASEQPRAGRRTRTVTLIGTAGHLHPGGLDTQLRDTRDGQTNTLFTSDAHYYEPAGEVSWDVSMGATPPSWRVQVQAGDTVSVHATYDTRRADWYEVMGIMPVAVYNGTDVGG